MQNILKKQIANKSLIKLGSYCIDSWCTHNCDLAVINPYDNSILIELSDFDFNLTKKVLDQAKNSQSEWAEVPAEVKSKLLFNWYRLVLENQEDLAKLITLEQGKPIKESIAEIVYAAQYIKWFAEESTRIYGTVLSSEADQQIQITKHPIGVVSLITPWNFPAAMLTRKMAPALVAGCSIIAKPSELTPLTALALTELAYQAGFPNGLIQTIITTSPKEYSKQINQSHIIKKISFTGSTRVGKELISQSAENVTKLSLELGGNAPFIIFEDADLDLAANDLIQSKFRNSGQTCICVNRVFVHSKVKAKFLQILIGKVSGMVMGNGLTPNTDLGPISNLRHIKTVQNWVESSIVQGAQLAFKSKAPPNKNFYPVTILDNVSNQMDIAQNELFAPVLPIIEFADNDDAITQATDIVAGLAAYVYSTNYQQLKKIQDSLEFGMVGFNTVALSDVKAPFGGVKQSGIGREGSFLGIEEYLEVKYTKVQY